MSKLIRTLATCRNFRQVVVVRSFRTTTNISQFATQCVSNSVVRDFRTTALQFAGLKTILQTIFVRSGKWSDFTTLNLSNSIGFRNIEWLYRLF